MLKKLFKVLACTLTITACTSDQTQDDSIEVGISPPKIYTVNYPLAYFAERIADGTVDVIFPAPADVDPANWSPDASIVADYQQADLVIVNGAGYAGWIQRATLSQSRLVDTSKSFADDLITVKDTVTHSHGPGGEHSHDVTAFTTWLDLDLAIEQARAVFDALVHQRPEAADDYRQRMAGLESDLGELDSRLQAIAGRIGQQPLMFSHPVYQYLVRGYELDGRSVHWEPHEMPDDDQWHELSDMLATHQATWMIWEDDPLPETARRLADMGIESVVFRPGGNRPAEGDFLGVMRDNVTALEQAFADDSAPLD